MTDRVGFYGDASLPHYTHRGHYEYGPEIRGIPAYGAVEIPRELWGAGSETHTPHDREHYRQWDHKHLLPWVQVRPEHRICRMRELGNKGHHWNCACSQNRTEGQAPGMAQLTHTANYTVFACWDYTGDMRGGCYSMFWIKGRVGANDIVAVIKRDFPMIWARITAGGGTMEVRGDDPPLGAATIEPETTYDLSIPDELFVKAELQLVPLVEEVERNGMQRQAYSASASMDVEKALRS
jgi:hypothetical protein